MPFSSMFKVKNRVFHYHHFEREVNVEAGDPVFNLPESLRSGIMGPSEKSPNTSIAMGQISLTQNYINQTIFRGIQVGKHDPCHSLLRREWQPWNHRN